MMVPLAVIRLPKGVFDKSTSASLIFEQPWKHVVRLYHLQDLDLFIL